MISHLDNSPVVWSGQI